MAALMRFCTVPLVANTALSSFVPVSSSFDKISHFTPYSWMAVPGAPVMLQPTTTWFSPSSPPYERAIHGCTVKSLAGSNPMICTGIEQHPAFTVER